MRQKLSLFYSRKPRYAGGEPSCDIAVRDHSPAISPDTQGGNVVVCNRRFTQPGRLLCMLEASPPVILRETLPRAVDLAPAERWTGCLTVIVPVYNEVAHLEELLGAVLASPVEKEVIIVDDGSTDGTRVKLQSFSSNPQITILFHEKNCGKGAAIRTALAYARGEFVLIQDSDLEYDPQDYPALLLPLQQGASNVVYGVRPDRPERGLRFFLGAKFLTHLTNFLYGTRIHDEATCYKVFRRSLLTRMTLSCRRFEFCPEVTAKLCRMGERIQEVPIAYNPRSAVEGKKIRHSDGWLAIWTLIRYRFIPQGRWLQNQ